MAANTTPVMLSSHKILALRKPLQPNARMTTICKRHDPGKAIQLFCHQNTSKQQTLCFLALAAKRTDLSLEGVMDEVPQLPEGLHRASMPRHVAIIMDGNSRWAKQRGLPTPSGHEAGMKSLAEVRKFCHQLGIKIITVFLFSLDNWNRSKEEVDFLMSLIEKMLKSELDDYMREGTRVSIIGDTSRLPKFLQRTISETEEMTRGNSKFHFIIATSYSGTYDMAQACKKVAQKVKDGVIQVKDIIETTIEQELETKCCQFPCPDLLIRTSGELRISNFLLWQSAYSELFFAKALWPDFGKDELVEALTSYQPRQRRFGRRNS